MASSSGTSSGSSFIQNSGSEEDLQALQALMDQRKRKRMISNRESARRSRMRKLKHLDDLIAQVAQLRKENQQIATSVNVTTEHYLKVETENSILRAQVAELSHRLQSSNDLLQFLKVSNAVMGAAGEPSVNSFHLVEPSAYHPSFFNPLSMPYMNQPIMAAAHMSLY